VLHPQTQDATMNEAYKNLSEHIGKFADFDAFYRYFLTVVKTDDQSKINKWLLKVLFVLLKQNQNHKHDFDKLCEIVDMQKREDLMSWLKESLKKAMEAKK